MPPKPRQNPLFFPAHHQRPSPNRPVAHGGLFSKPQPFDLRRWDPQDPSPSPPPRSFSPLQSLSAARRLSPIARFIVDAFRKGGDRWGPEVVSELRKLRRVTPDLVAEVLKVENSPQVATKFFHWAGKQKGYKHNYASYNAFAYCLNRGNLFRAADQLPELMDSQGKPPSEQQFEMLIRMHCDSNRGLRVYYVYEKMKKFGVRPRVFLYNRVMEGLVKTGHLDLALSVYEDFGRDGLVEENVTYMVLVKGLCKAGRLDEVVEMLGRMRENGCRPDVFAYTAMVKLLIGEGNVNGCLRVWDEMRWDGVEPDVMAYGTFVTGLCKGGMVEKGYEVFEEMKRKGVLIDRAIYGVLVEGFVAKGKVRPACDLFKDLVSSGYRADLGIYNSLIRGLCNAKLVDKAHKLFQAVVKEGLQPDFATVYPMLLSYAEIKNMDDLHKLLVQMEKLGFSVADDLSRFFSFMVGNEDGISLALEVFEELKQKGYASVAIYNILMESLLKIGNVEKALFLFREIENSELEPDAATHSTAILCFVEEGNVQEACASHNKIIEMSCVPSIAAYRSLAKGLCSIREIDSAMMLVRDCLANIENGPTEFKYTLTILHACKSGSEKVIEVLNEMMQEGCPPNEVIYSALISGMCKHATLEEARKVFANMRQRKLLTEAKEIAYDEILIEHMLKKTGDLILSGLKFFGLESKLKAKSALCS